jgi:hypothetical protein
MTDLTVRGLDIGTVNLVAAEHDDGGEVILKRQRNVFLDVPADGYTRNMLTRLRVPYALHAGKLYVLGDPAFELANVLNRRTRRPMSNGLISPREADAIPVMKLLLRNLLGAPESGRGICTYSVPAEPVDAEANVVYHREVFDAILRAMGYEPRAILEGHAVVFAELGDDDFTGIGISCGGGMFNVCVAYKSMPCIAFSTSRGGDWIDQNVARVLGIAPERATFLKERGLDLTAPRTREEEAFVIYYRNLIQYTLQRIAEEFESAQNLPAFPDPVAIVCAGGTAMARGFLTLFRQELERVRFPLPVREVRIAEDPFHSVARGALIAALSEVEV